jgi:hypothetical protein
METSNGQRIAHQFFTAHRARHDSSGVVADSAPRAPSWVGEQISFMKFLFVCAVLFCGGRCVAQVQVPPDQCLGGNLIGIQPDSVTSKFNDKISTYRFAPGAEIWSRGTDVESPMQLTIGDEVYIRCTRTEANGPVLITVLAAVEQDDAISLEPHHIKAISVCIGKLVTRTPETLSLKSEKGVCVIHTTAQTTYWRGGISHDPGILKTLDEVSARVIVGYPGRVLTADGEVEANVAKVEGPIVGLDSRSMVIKSDRWQERWTVLLDAHTEFVQGDKSGLKKGGQVMVIGLDLRPDGTDAIRATRIWVY